MDFDYSFPTVASSHFKFQNTVTIAEFDPSRVVTDVKPKKMQPEGCPAPFFDIAIKYDYSDAQDGSEVGPFVITADDDAPMVIDWGVSPPSEDAMKTAGGNNKIPNHSIKIDLSDESETGKKLRGIYIAIKEKVVEILVANVKNIGSVGTKAMMSTSPNNFFDSIIKPHDVSKRKMPDGEYEFVPAKFLNLVGFTNRNKVTGELKPDIKTHFYAPTGESSGKVDVHVKNLIKKKITILPYIYFQRIYCGANVSIQSFLDSAIVLDVADASSRELAPATKNRLATLNATGAGKFKELCRAITSTTGPSSPRTVSSEHQAMPDEPARPADTLGGSDSDDEFVPPTTQFDFDKSLEAVTTAQATTTTASSPPPKRAFRRAPPTSS